MDGLGGCGDQAVIALALAQGPVDEEWQLVHDSPGKICCVYIIISIRIHNRNRLPWQAEECQPASHQGLAR
jgi:hypothetical protein